MYLNELRNIFSEVRSHNNVPAVVGHVPDCVFPAGEPGGVLAGLPHLLHHRVRARAAPGDQRHEAGARQDQHAGAVQGHHSRTCTGSSVVQDQFAVYAKTERKINKLTEKLQSVTTARSVQFSKVRDCSTNNARKNSYFCPLKFITDYVKCIFLSNQMTCFYQDETTCCFLPHGGR